MAMLSLLALLPLAAAAAPRDKVRLANGAWMPLVSAGTWQYNDTEAASAVKAALAAGFRHVDTAYNYRNQRGVSHGLLESGLPRNKVFVTTKVPGCGVTVPKENCFLETLKLITEDLMELSSSGYEVGYIDLLLLHCPPCIVGDDCRAKRNGCSDPANCRAVAEQWRAVEAAHEMGMLRAAGVSNYCRRCFACLGGSGFPPVVNQVQLHVGMGPDPQGFVSYAKRSGVVLQAWSPLGHGGGGSPEILKGNLTRSIGEKHGKSAAQVALKWIVQRGLAVTTKSNNERHLRENLDLFSWDLDEEDLARLDEADFARKDTPSDFCEDPSAAELLLV